MRIGVGKEIKPGETRAGLMPEQVARLVHEGHVLYVEIGAGVGSGFVDAEYEAAGAKAVAKRELYERCDLIVKVKAPLDEEVSLLGPHHTLFTYLHLDGNAPVEYAQQLCATGGVGIAYEWVEKATGELPLLSPMSDITGVLFARRSMELLMSHAGMLGGDYVEGCPPARALVIGLGHIGKHASKVFLRNGFDLTVVDIEPERALDSLAERLGDAAGDGWRKRIEVITSSEDDPLATQQAIAARLPATDILICAAVRRPSLPVSRCRYLVTRQMIALMQPGRIVCDATASMRDLVETCVPTEILDETYVEEGVVHYNPDHIPALTPRPATRLLTQATFPYLRELAAKGWREALTDNLELRGGLMYAEGAFWHPVTCKAKGLPLTSYEVLFPPS